MVNSLTQHMDQLTLHASYEAKTLKTTQGAHTDDIHVFLPHPQGFVTGSKDTWVKFWDAKLHPVRSVPHPNLQKGYARWVTAGTYLQDADAFVAGYRSGSLSYIPRKQVPQGMFYSIDIHQTAQVHCKERNANRVTTLSQCVLGHTRYLVSGHPTKLGFWKLNTKHAPIQSWFFKTVADNDWVYVFRQIACDRAFVVTGANLHLYRMTLHTGKTPLKVNFLHERTCIQGTRSIVKNPQPLISSIDHLSASTYLLSLFNSRVGIYDATQNVCRYYDHAHDGRVWSVCRKDGEAHTFFSCGDDALVKLWDVRVSKAVLTIGPDIGRVSHVLSKNMVCHTTSCRDQGQSASITSYDIRQTQQKVQTPLTDH